MVAQVLLSLSGDRDQPKEVPMEVKIISTPDDEAFVVEVIVSLEKFSTETVDAADPLKEVIGIISLLVTGSHARMIGIVRPSMADPLIELILGTKNSPARKSCVSGVVEAKVYALEVLQIKLYTPDVVQVEFRAPEAAKT